MCRFWDDNWRFFVVAFVAFKLRDNFSLVLHYSIDAGCKGMEKLHTARGQICLSVGWRARALRRIPRIYQMIMFNA